MTEQQIRSINMGGVRIPEHMIGATLRYFNDHIEPGDFLRALLENDFIEACGRGQTSRTWRHSPRGRRCSTTWLHPTPTGAPGG